MKKIFIIISLGVISFISYAQQDILLSQYMFNQLLINPAYAGSKDYMMATLLYRDQWAGWKNAPSTEVASLHGPIGITNLGWGALISHDHEGVTDRTDMYANVAYHLKLNEKLKLGLGLRGGGSYWVRNNAAIRDILSHHTAPGEWDPNDPQYAGDQVSNFLPNFGTGLFLYSKRFYAGLSVPEVLSYDPDKFLNAAATLLPRAERHHFFTAGYAFPVSPDIVLKPSVLVKYVKDAPVEGDFNLNALFYNVLWLGASYRTGDAFVAILELQITKKLRFGYSYDFTTTAIQNYSSGSHEVMLGYDFGYDIMKMKTPRYF